jgi:hypothetical protein
LVIIAGFTLLNGLVFVAYRSKTYPSTYIGGQKLGSVSNSQLANRLKQLNVLPKTVRFNADGQTATASTAALGISVDYDKLSQEVRRHRHWLPVANLLTTQRTALTLRAPDKQLQAALDNSLAGFHKEPANAKIVRDGSTFSIKPDSSGQTIDMASTKRTLLQALATGQATIKVTTKSLGAAVTSNKLAADLQQLKQQSSTAISLQYNGQTHKLTAEEIASLFDLEASPPVLSDSTILTIVNTTGSANGVVVDNQPAAVAAIKSAVQNHKNLTYTLTAAPKPSKTIRYCTALRGVPDSELKGLESKLQSTYNDSRGWSLNGSVRFEKASDACDLTVWLSSADQMASFGAICDSLWSCTVHPYVIINYDRWRNASDAWNAAYGSENGSRLDDYRSMVINHETGHWFGFNHTFCSAAGQPAPVMQQQSIDLRGCSFNPWPLDSEQAALKSQLGL